MKLNHHTIRINPERLERPAGTIHVGRFGSAVVHFLGIPEDVSDPILALTTPDGSLFSVPIKDGEAYVEPGMINAVGEGAFHVLAKDARGADTPLGFGRLEVARFPMAASAKTSVLPVSSVMDVNGVSRQLLAVQDETGAWTLTVGDVVETPANGTIKTDKLPGELGTGDSLGAVKAAVNAIRKAVGAPCIALAIGFASLFQADAETLNDLPGDTEIMSAQEVKDEITNTVTKAYVESLGITGGGGAGIQAGTDGAAVTNIVDGIVARNARDKGDMVVYEVGELRPPKGVSAEWIEQWEKSIPYKTFYSATEDRLATTNQLGEGLAKLEEDINTIFSDWCWELNDMIKAIPTNDIQTAMIQSSEALAYANGVYNYMHADENAWFSGTNYVFGADAASRHRFAFEDGMDLGTVPCSMALIEKRDGVNQMVWDQRDWTSWYWAFKARQLRTEIAATNAVIYGAISGKADKAWSKHTSASGRDNPDTTTTWVETESVTIAPGMAWETVATVSGCSYWTIVGDGARIGGRGSGSVLEIKDFEGNSAMWITKTDSYMTYLECGSEIYTSGYDNQGRVTFTMRASVQPVAEFTTDPRDDFIGEDDPACPAVIEWEEVEKDKVYRIHFLAKPGVSACFAKFKVEVEGSTTVEYANAPTFHGGLIFGGKKIAPVIPAGAKVGDVITWKVVQ